MNINEKNIWQQKVLLLKNAGYSNRYIAKEIWGDSNKEYTIRRFLKKVSNPTISSNNDLYNEYTKPDNSAKILYYDLECSPTKAYIWRRFKENISQAQVLEESFLLTHSWAWNDGEIYGTRLTGKEALEENDEVLVEQAWHLFNNASVIVMHNGRRFDAKKLNARFVLYGFPPPSPYKIVDTLEICKAKFGFPSNKLNDVCQYLGIGVKADTGGFDTWKNSCAGDDNALEYMLQYNRQDIHLGRELYKKLRGFDNNGVNVAVMQDNVGALCPNCGSDDVHILENKFAYTPNGKYQVYTCGGCYTNMRSTTKTGKRNSFVRVV